VSSAQAAADCQYANTCPLGHAFNAYGKTFGDGVTETYTVTADRVTTSAHAPASVGPVSETGDGTLLPGYRFVSAHFTIHGLAGDGGTDDSAGNEASLTGSDGKTYLGDDISMVQFDPTPGSVASGWVTFKAVPDGVTPVSIQWGNSATWTAR
jgi:hypothetical protein